MSLTRTPGKKATRACPCGWLGDSAGRCRCTLEQVQKYRARVSGPLLDRIDLQLQVARLEQRTLLADEAIAEECSALVRERVVRARERQMGRAGKPNAELGTRELGKHCRLDAPLRRWLAQALDRLRLSARATHRILRVARTLADLQQADDISQAHLAEAIGYRALERGDSRQ